MAKNNWLNGRIGVMAKYTEELPAKQDRISIRFDYPDAGWMPVHFIKNGMDLGILEFTDVYDCFVPIREWLESIATIACNKASAVNLDCERWHGVLYYEPIWFYDYENYKGDLCPLNCGIFSVYDEAEDRFILDAFCETRTFVEGIYKCIIDFAKAMKEKPEFIDDWVASSWNQEWGTLDDDDPKMNEIFLSKVRSEKVEKYIRQNSSIKV